MSTSWTRKPVGSAALIWPDWLLPLSSVIRWPDPAVIERLMKRFIYSAGVIGVMQVATLVIMTKLASG